MTMTMMQCKDCLSHNTMTMTTALRIKYSHSYFTNIGVPYAVDNAGHDNNDCAGPQVQHFTRQLRICVSDLHVEVAGMVSAWRAAGSTAPPARATVSADVAQMRLQARDGGRLR